MTNCKLILGSLIAAIMTGASLDAAARTNVDFYVNFAPPPLRHEVVPAPRVGWVWVPGFWDWRSHRHHWVAGRHVRHRTHPGWRRDRDGDGVPNRFDRAPHNPYYR